MQALLVIYRTKKCQTRPDLKLRFVSLHDSADNGDINVLGTNVVCRGDHGDVDIYNESVRRLY